jgi:hypothetical protein
MKKRTYIQWYEHFKVYQLDILEEIRRQICQDDKREDTSLRLEVIDDLMYLRENNIPL